MVPGHARHSVAVIGGGGCEEGRGEFPMDNGGVEVEGSRWGLGFEDWNRSWFDREGGGGFRGKGTVVFFVGEKTLK